MFIVEKERAFIKFYLNWNDSVVVCLGHIGMKSIWLNYIVYSAQDRLCGFHHMEWMMKDFAVWITISYM